MLAVWVHRLQRFVEHVTSTVMGTSDASASPQIAAIPNTPSVAAFASGVAAELAPLTRDLLAIETTGELPAAAPSAAGTEDGRSPWWRPQAPVRGGELTLLGVLAASQPAMRRLAFLAEVRPGSCSRKPRTDLLLSAVQPMTGPSWVPWPWLLPHDAIPWWTCLKFRAISLRIRLGSGTITCDFTS